MGELISREDMESDLMEFIHTETGNFPMSKKMAVDRYMRKVLRALTTSELNLAIQIWDRNHSHHPDIIFKISQASEGYDRFMAKHGR